MKKAFFLMLLALVSSLTITSCTEEAIQPTRSDSAPGGVGMADKSI